MIELELAMCTDPGIMKMFRVDRGAIKFVLSGANIMCPGLTSAGGALDEEVLADAPVVCALSPIFSFLFELRRRGHPNLFFCQGMLVLKCGMVFCLRVFESFLIFLSLHRQLWLRGSSTLLL